MQRVARRRVYITVRSFIVAKVYKKREISKASHLKIYHGITLATGRHGLGRR